MGDNRIREPLETKGTRGRSSAGRAPALQAGGQEFESLRLHPSSDKQMALYLENRILNRDKSNLKNLNEDTKDRDIRGCTMRIVQKRKKQNRGHAVERYPRLQVPLPREKAYGQA